MKFGTSVVIFLLAIVTLVAELILYFVVGLGAAFSGDMRTLSGAAFFFVSLMILTAATGILAPICAVIELVAKKKNVGLYVMLPTLGAIVVGLALFNILVPRDISRPSPPRTPATSSAASGSSSEAEQSDLNKKSYFAKVVVQGVEIGKSVLDETGVFGEIKNTGDKTLTQVEITIYCMDENDSPIFEKKYHPVLVSEYSFTRDNEPLKPNYSRKFGVKLLNIT